MCHSKLFKIHIVPGRKKTSVTIKTKVINVTKYNKHTLIKQSNELE